MTLPESLLADLVDYWTFDAGLEVGTDWLAEVESADGGGPITQIGKGFISISRISGKSVTN